jgi:uncharacterized protein
MSALRSQPFFLDAADDQVFTLHYPAEQSRDVIVICPPAPQETMRSQASLGQLARRLHGDGHSVLRFDYRGTGDSSGSTDTTCLDQWLEDVLQVCRYGQSLGTGKRLSLIGLRLGGALAIRASQQLDIERLVLWDPIVDGLHYMQTMEISHARMFDLNVVEPPFASWRYGKDQCWGFPWNDAWRSQLAAISPTLLLPKARDLHIILSATDTLVRDATQDWEKRGVDSHLQHVGEPMDWGDERYVKIRAFPTAHLRRIQALWEGSVDA